MPAIESLTGYGASTFLAMNSGGTALEFVAKSLYATVASPTFTGTPAAPTAGAATNTTQIATTAFVQQEIAAKAPLASPTFTGTPAAPTATLGTNTTQVATTAFVKAAIDALLNAAPGALDTLDELAAALGDDANFATTMTNALAAKAPLASPTFTGTPAAPTAAAATNTTQIATTAHVFAERTNTATLTNKTLTSPTINNPVLSGTQVGALVEYGFACSDETTAIAVGTAKQTFRMPIAMTVTEVRASVTTAPTGSTIIIDINDGGVSILSTKLSIDASEKTSETAATPAVISDTALAKDAEITIDFDQVGSTVAGAGVKVWIAGTRA